MDDGGTTQAQAPGLHFPPTFGQAYPIVEEKRIHIREIHQGSTVKKWFCTCVTQRNMHCFIHDIS